jgi:protein-S-isoprenylcysteine O-methyltransferase Ste14
MSTLGKQETAFIIANILIVLCTSVLLLAILIDFIRYHKPYDNKKKVNSWVETGSMFLFFLVYYAIMNLKRGKLNLDSQTTSVLSIIGSILIVLGCYVNVMGRFSLKQNWANQVTIYHNHTLVTTGMYRLVRHPLYASIIWMLIGGCFVYASYIALFAVLLIFIPMMHYRAEQEEKLLQSEFPEYSAYKNKVPMFFPKFF